MYLFAGSCTNPYGRTKYFNEGLLRDVCLSDDKWNVVLLRYFNPVGAHKSGTLLCIIYQTSGSWGRRGVPHRCGWVSFLYIYPDDDVVYALLGNDITYLSMPLKIQSESDIMP